MTELSSSGQVILRTGWDIKADWLYFKNGPLGGGHGHQDKLHVGLWLDGEEILTDGGRYTYTDTQERYWLKSAAAHNVPLADAEEYADSIDSWVIGHCPSPFQTGSATRANISLWKALIPAMSLRGYCYAVGYWWSPPIYL